MFTGWRYRMDQNVLNEVLDMGIMLTAEKDYDELLSEIIDCAMKITHCDAGTLYTYDGARLQFCIMKNKSMGIEQNAKDDKTYPAVEMSETNVCAYSAIHRRMLNIPDVYASEEFDFNGPGRYDSMTGYRTKSMLVYPLVNNEDNLVGVVQLINALDENGNVIAFPKEIEIAVKSLASQVSIAVSNMQYVKEIEELMISITQSFTDAIDTRIPYNFYHSRNVYLYTEMIIDHINNLYKKGKGTRHFSHTEKKELLLAALMHDIGKLVIPSEVIDKSTRLGDKIDIVLQRFDYLTALYHIDYLEGRITKNAWTETKNELISAKEQLEQINKKTILSDEDIQLVKDLRGRTYSDALGHQLSYLTLEEAEALSIPKGNLTAREREIICSHVIYTEKYLNNMKFGRRYPHIIEWAGAHHEFLDGSGYPRHLKGDGISFETRILTVVDIYEALTSADRPYKKSMDDEHAFEVLDEMAAEGKIDAEVIKLLREALAEHSEGQDTFSSQGR